MSLIHRAGAIAAALFCLSGAALAQTEGAEPFSLPAFQASQAAGEAILVEVTAPWCPTCRAQKPILDGLLTQPEFSQVRVFNVDFDSQKAELRVLDVRMQSTLIAYRGTDEVGRSVGDTNPGSIAGLLSGLRP